MILDPPSDCPVCGKPRHHLLDGVKCSAGHKQAYGEEVAKAAPRSAEHDYAVAAAQAAAAPEPGSDASVRAILSKPDPFLVTPTMRANNLARDLCEFASEIMGYASRIAGSQAGLGVEQEARLVKVRVDAMAERIRDFAARAEIDLTREPGTVDLGTMAIERTHGSRPMVTVDLLSAIMRQAVEFNPALRRQISSAVPGDTVVFSFEVK